MDQKTFDRAVASATGESVVTIRRRGFVPLRSVPFERDSFAGAGAEVDPCLPANARHRRMRNRRAT